MSNSDEELAAVLLEAVAGVAKATAMDVRMRRLWEGDLSRRIQSIYEYLNNIPKEKR